MNVAPGAIVNRRYRVDAEVGSGGMGTVFRCRDLQLGRDVAIKVLSPRVLQRDGAIARFEREARVGAQISHPHIIQTLDFGSADGVWYLVLQLVTGGDLLQYQAQRRPLSIHTVCEIGYQLADALAAAHALGVVHRDLKPENVLVEPGDELHLRIADFGMAYLSGAVDPRDGRLTRDGELGGTPMYMAPEQIANQTVGPPVDVYALGCMLFELVAGAPPFQGNAGTLLAKQLYSPPPRLCATRPDAPAGLDELVDRMLGKAFASRPPADAVRHRLAIFLDHHAQPNERSRDVAYTSDRNERMISLPNTPTETMYRPDPDPGEDSVFLGLQGALDADTLTALQVAGFAIGSDALVAWISIGQSLAEIEKLVTTGLPVIADSSRQDFERVSQLARIGVAEVLLEPLLPHAVVRKIQRALQTARRRHDRT